MKKLNGYEIRKMWLDFFSAKGHSIEESASLIPNDDPTLLWINAGVAPLKSYFDGTKIPSNPRIVNAQKCIRTNDIDNVGMTSRHHTFFEMLGNFSVGDYFRDEIIPWAFELLTSEEWFDFDKDLLYVTVYPSDDITKELWLKCGMEESHIIKTDYNFWEIGEGPCGPCTEIFYDRGIAYGDLTSDVIRDDIENGRYIEIWNIVFSQYNSKPGLERSQYPELPCKNIDTGMGLERMACVLQEVSTNFDTDMFRPIIKKIEDISGIKYSSQMSFKVIVDHIKTITFAVSDGAMLSNEGRGYVLRRILRRAVKYGKSLNIKKPFLHELVDTVVDTMSNYYPYLIQKAEFVKDIVKVEENKFLDTIASGELKIAEIISKSKKVISGIDAFTLYDTYGFPVELTLEYALESNMTVDIDGFNEEMEKQKDRARSARKSIQSMKEQNGEFIKFTDKSEFIGYTNYSSKSKIIKVFKDGIVLDKTPFYAESGGQGSDAGVIKIDSNEYNVIDVLKLPNGQFLHILDSNVNIKCEGVVCEAIVDMDKRNLSMYNHSATHLLFKVLRDKLGTHVSQQGSQVNDQNLRFDFNHLKLLKDDEIIEIEKTVNEYIKKGNAVTIKETTIDEALKLGAIAEFGEKYTDKVRVVNMGHTIDLCGGTHVSNINTIEKLAILGVESKGSGIYRIEGVTNKGVDGISLYLENYDKEIKSIISKGNSIINKAKKQGIDIKFDVCINNKTIGSYQDIINKRNELSTVQNMVKNLEKEYNKEKEKLALNDISSFEKSIVDNKLIVSVSDLDSKVLKKVVDSVIDKYKLDFVFIADIIDSKVIFVAKSSVKGIHCGSIVKIAATICGGNGGGRPDMAQAGGKDICKVNDALAEVKEAVK